MIRKRLVGYARIEKRRDRRRPTRLTARIGDQPAEIVDISLGGLGISNVVARPPAPRAYKLGQVCTITLDVPSYGTISLQAEVARIDTARHQIGLRFIDLDSDSYRVIERLSIGRMRPSSADDDGPG